MIKVILFDIYGVFLLSGNEGIYINPQTLDFIQKNRGKYAFALISQTDFSEGAVRDFLMRNNLNDDIKEVITSGETGLSKENPAIYKLALEKLGLQPEEAVLVDDRMGYLNAAKQAGIEGVLYNEATFEMEVGKRLN